MTLVAVLRQLSECVRVRVAFWERISSTTGQFSEGRFGSAMFAFLVEAAESSQCEAQDDLRIYRNLRFGSLLLRTSQLAPAIVRNNN